MATTEKIAISLPREIVRRVEKARKITGETRSSFIRRALELALKEQERKAMVAKYLDGYEKHPETAEEISAALASATQLLAVEPWE